MLAEGGGLRFGSLLMPVHLALNKSAVCCLFFLPARWSATYYEWFLLLGHCFEIVAIAQ
jgi:hypothetical protein